MKSITSSYPRNFWKLCLACLLFFGSFSMVIPDLSLLLTKLNGREYIWLIIPSFAITALITRPFSGILSDKVGRVYVMILGAIISSIASGLYIIIPFISLFFLNRALHGFCAGFTPTGFTAYADDIVPIEKRGEAMGIVGICNNIGTSIGWVFGNQISSGFGLNIMFIVASLMGLVSVWMFKQLPETVKNPEKPRWNMFKIRAGDLIERDVLLPGIVLLFTVFTSGTVLALIPEFSLHLGIANKGLYMGIYIFSSLIIRFMAGRWSDQYGRKRISFFGAFTLVISMGILAFAQDIWSFAASSILFGIGFGLLSPSLFAWAVDLSKPGRKGKAVGTLFIFLELGIIAGSGISGLIYADNSSNFKWAFLCSAIISLLAVLLLMASSDRIRSISKKTS